MRMLALLAGLLATALQTGGCTVVRIYGSANDQVQVKQGVGVVSVQVTPGAGAVVVDAVSFGAISRPDGFTLGYHAGTTALIERGGCHLVVWVSADTQLKELKELLSERTDVCAVRPQYAKGEMR